MFKLACGDVMPGCPARFETTDRDLLLGRVATHARDAHGIVDLTPEVVRAVEAKIAS
jgi:predicted small metal-binding protein